MSKATLVYPQRYVPLEHIAESKTNPRRTLDKAALAELTESVKRLGILQPLLVRPANGNGPSGPYELVAGHRRLAAARAAELAHVPVTVRELTDLEVLEIQLIENLQRSDLHPLEEAESYRILHEKHGYSIEDLAVKVGKSRGYVYARLKLTALPKAAKEAFFEGKLNPSTALLVARIPDRGLAEKAAKEIVAGDRYGDERGEPMSYRAARDHIEREYMLRLKDAPFPTGDAELVPKAGPCTNCPKRTGNQPELFGDVKSADVCTDPRCFEAKSDAAWKRKTKEAEAKGQEVLSAAQSKKVLHDYGDGTDVRSGSGFRSLSQTCWEDPKNRTYRAILGKHAPLPVLARSENGAVVELVREKDLAQGLKAAGFKKQSQANGSSKREKKQRETRKADRAVALRAIEQVVAAAEVENNRLAPFFMRAVIRRTSWSAGKEVIERRAIERSKPLSRRGFSGDETDVLIAAAEKMKPAQMWGLLVELLLTDPDSDEPLKDATLTDACETFGVDLDAIRKTIAAEKPATKTKGRKTHRAAAKGRSQKPRPGTCAECGCTEENACETESGEPCTWVNEEQTICSACLEAAEAGA